MNFRHASPPAKLRLPLCNRDPSTAPRCCGKSFLLCWRCSGGILGVLCGSFLNRAHALSPSEGWILAAVMVIGIDYALRRKGPLQNLRRFSTGVFFGLTVTAACLARFGTALPFP